MASFREEGRSRSEGTEFVAARHSLRWRITAAFVVLVLLPLGWIYYFAIDVLETHPGLLATLVFFFAFSTGVVFQWAGQLAKTLEEYTGIVRRLEAGHGASHYWMDQPDELGQLAKAIYETTESVRHKIHQLSQDKTKFETILESMVEGVVGFDHMGRILLMNSAAEQMLRIQSDRVRGKLLLEAFRHRELESLLIQALNTGEVQKKQLQLWPNKPQTFRVQVVPVWTEQRRLLGAAMVIDDVTEVRRLEQMRTEFVANVSHELRTPLTSIKGFVETLLDGALDDAKVAKRFLSIINEETQRLQRLIEDLLQLSRIESQAGRAVEDQAFLEPEMQRVRNLLEPIALEKRITLQVDVQKNLPQLPLSPDNLKQVLVNLTENAIKYTPEGGRVHVRAFRQDQNVTLEVQDTGIGIPEESLPRIFERFYRVDKARSREMGGTGLGLAIVKHIIERSGGRVTVHSQVGAGSIFTVSFPALQE
ncbi:phosphate regulon sensor histidine kinase PhoR [Heliobacterium gestii]|uniref:Phosphate regulon sensor protein PhoR n=1 Tax=Heliomicrobium gestii TaxID=2699 RepID=A0A845LEU0_HELGE|nr:phosphate regulon sensor histidine kinase PhoR [Heliomicrobium gestii]MBM7867548.1 two-component system phosphate regulon sensor histidine kinase PhoR [Heliomicrobium gestii]MZP43904.1 phosphate regulon sensor histidine kinase PhoR [Heliomicrobium gestii]